MDTRLTQAEAAYLLPVTTPEQERLRALRQAAAEAHRAALAKAIGRGLARLGDALFGWVRRGRVRAELEALSDRELADIGLTRGDIPRVLAEHEAATTAKAPARRPAGIPVPRPA